MALSKAARVFTADEYALRLTNVRQAMTAAEVDHLLVTDFSNIVYLTGYTGDSAYVPQMLHVAVDDATPTFVCRRQDAPGAVHQSWLLNENIVGYPELYVGNPDANGFDYAAALLRPALAGRRVGIEAGILTRRDEQRILTGLGRDAAADCSGLVGAARIVKSAAEIVVMREAAAITSAAMRVAADGIAAGVRESDLAGDILRALARGVDGIAGTHIVSPLICSTPRTGTPHMTWTDRVYAEGTQINVEVGASRHRYVAAQMRTFHVGPPPERLRSVHTAHAEGLEAALAAVRPGATCSDVANAFHRALGAHGLRKDSRCGYSIGINWMEPVASLKPEDQTVLQPDMTFHLMLGNWIEEDFGYVISETFRVTATGVEVLTDMPRELFVR